MRQEPLSLLFEKVLQERGTWCRTSTTEDLKYVLSRVEHEGTSFLTITLPTFGKGLEKALAAGKIERSSFAGFPFSRSPRKRGLPSLFSGFLALVFDSRSGLLLDNPDVDAIRAVRQLSLMFGKIEQECSEPRKRAALRQYIETEQHVKDADARRTPEQTEAFRRMAFRIFGGLFDHLNRKVEKGQIVPSHSSGATADRLMGNQKYGQHEWTERLEFLFPHGEFLAPGVWYNRELEHVDMLEPRRERPVKVILVPKTPATPRIIAEEPTCMQYVQQGLKDEMYEYVDRDPFLSKLIGFRKQEPNQLLAREGSLTGDLATLDLSEASDRVSNELVRQMLAWYPFLNEGIDACRSRSARIEEFDTTLRLAKFASMGSALTFPLEAIVFTTVIFLAIEAELGRRISDEELRSYAGRVRVYGDDLIVPVTYVQSTLAHLEAFGFVVNTRKSFWTGRFRESCGKEFYAGEDVSIVRVRHEFPDTWQDAERLESLVSLRNQLYKAGSWETCKWLDGVLGSLLPAYPVVAETSPALGRHSFLGYQADYTEVGKTMQRPMVRAVRVVPRIPRNEVDGWPALMKCLLQGLDPDTGMPTGDKRHLTHSGRPLIVDTKFSRVSAI